MGFVATFYCPIRIGHGLTRARILNKADGLSLCVGDSFVCDNYCSEVLQTVGEVLEMRRGSCRFAVRDCNLALAKAASVSDIFTCFAGACWKILISLFRSLDSVRAVFPIASVSRLSISCICLCPSKITHTCTPVNSTAVR